MGGMYEIECPYCGKVTQVKDGKAEEQSGKERPKLACFKCWNEHERTSIPEPSQN
jgi:hypothetical protein